MNQTVNEISFKCSRSTLEDSDNLFGEIIYRNLDISIIFGSNPAIKRTYLPGNVIVNRRGIPSVIFLGCSLLKDNCCQVFSLGFYVSSILLHTQLIWILFNLHYMVRHLGPVYQSTEEFPDSQ